jgi:hypothetical protein
MITRTREIAKDEWRLFFDNTSRHYLGREVKVELLGPDLGVHFVARKLPLIGITVEKGANGETEIEIIAGDLERGHVSHTVSSPEHVWIEQEINGGDNAIEIESAGGNAVVIELSASPQGRVPLEHAAAFL